MKSNNEIINNTITGKQIKVALQPTKYKDLDIDKQKIYDDIVSKINFLTDSEKLFDSVMKPIDDLIDLFKDDLKDYSELQKMLYYNFNIGDKFYFYDEKNNMIQEETVKAIALQPDNNIIINWIYNYKNVYKSKEKCLNAAISKVQANCALIIENLQKGVNNNG